MSLSAVNKTNYITTGLWIVGSIMSSVGLILSNKVIMGPPFNFGYVFTLTSIHFLVTTMEMEAMALAGFFERRRLPWTSSAIMSVFCTLSVGLMNLSLKLNSVGFYQLCKLLGIPWLVFIQRIVYKKHTSISVHFSLLVILTGMVLVIITDVSFNMVGTGVGLAAIIVTTQFQIWQGAKQYEHSLNAMQINYAQALPTFFVCTIVALLIEFNEFYTKNSILTHQLTIVEGKWIIFSAVLAGCVNLCTYGLIGNTSAITYQVVGHLKTVFILVGGYFLTHEQTPMTWRNLMGITICLGGAVLYGYVRHAEATGISLYKESATLTIIRSLRCLWNVDVTSTEREQQCVNTQNFKRNDL